MSKIAKGPISFCANIADMCAPFQIVSNCYAKILDNLNKTRAEILKYTNFCENGFIDYWLKG